MNIRRIVARYIKAELDVGKSFFIGDVKVHRYTNSLLVTEMTNAGKRGKRVRELHILPDYSVENVDDRLKKVADKIIDLANYDKILDYMKELGREFNLSQRQLRGVDVEPAGTTIQVKTDTNLKITSSPWDFKVLETQILPNGFDQDTIYYPLKKQDAIIFYTWVKANLPKVKRLSMEELRTLWDSLDIHYNYH